MTNPELLAQCKRGLNISDLNTSFDDVLNQKLLAVKSYMKRAGVNDATMNDDLAVGVIVIGITDLWKIDGGEVKFSPAFNTLLTQLTYN